ncbi:hypothetical protein HY409_01735 [Candidatus Gottesmanbacteria bacterium]|nr:hypothetical protein [Candidatus Gottesmanbacteria bacterium]
MPDATYQKFIHRWEEVTDLPPQSLGILTPYYKNLTKRLKVMPWFSFVGISLISIIGLYVFLGTTITLLVTVLQRGF